MPIGEEGKYIGMHIGRQVGKSAPGYVGKEKKEQLGFVPCCSYRVRWAAVNVEGGKERS